MIDFIKVKYTDSKFLENHVIKNKEKFPNLYSTLDCRNGSIEYPYKTTLDNMNISIYEKSGCIKNSIHKLWNVKEGNGDQNYNDFTFSRQIQTLDFLKENLSDFENQPLTQFEFGFNISTDVPAEELLKNNFVFHGFKAYSSKKKYKGKGYLKQFDHSNYVIKCYDKAKQYRLNHNVLRFEIRITRSREFNSLGIYKVSDLRDKENLKRLNKLLLKRFDEMLIVDNFMNKDDMSLCEKNELSKYLNPIFWEREELKGNYRTKAGAKESLSELLDKHNLLQNKSKIRTLLVNKFDYLINH